MKQADRIVQKFGGRAQMARDTPYHYERLRKIQRKGVFPAEDYPTLLQLGVELGVELTPYDFIAHLRDPRAANLESFPPAGIETGPRPITQGASA